MDWYICEKTEDEYLNRTAGIKAREDLDVIFKQCGMKMINLVVGEDTRLSLIHISEPTRPY